MFILFFLNFHFTTRRVKRRKPVADDMHPKSLRKVKVATIVEPKDGRVDRDQADKIAKSLKKEVKETLKKHSDKPSGEQVGKAMEKVAERTDEMKADGTSVDVGVVIAGTRGEGGEEEVHASGTGELAKEISEDASLDSSFEDDEDD